MLVQVRKHGQTALVAKLQVNEHAKAVVRNPYVLFYSSDVIRMLGVFVILSDKADQLSLTLRGL